MYIVNIYFVLFLTFPVKNVKEIVKKSVIIFHVLYLKIGVFELYM